MGKPRSLTDLQEEYLVKDYYSGMKQTDLAEKYHITQGSVRNVLKRNKAEFRDPLYFHQPSYDVQKAIEMYESGMSFPQTAKALGADEESLRLTLKRLGVKARQHTRKYKFNEGFFSSYTPESCYWAGFISADGNLSSQEKKYVISIVLNSKDRGHLEGFLRCINGDNKIREYKHPETGNLYSHLCISCPQWHSDLQEKFDIVPNKTLVLQPPLKIQDEELVWHYIRGNMDGDGSVHISGRRIIFCSASLDFMCWLNDIVGGTIHHVTPVETTIGKHTCISKDFYQLHVTTSKIYEDLYEDAYSNIMLDRKYERVKAVFPDVENLLKK